MCLSNVYEKSPDADNLLLRNIADVRFEGDTIVMTDIMGITRRIEATVKKIDLLENYIIVETKEQPAEQHAGCFLYLQFDTAARAEQAVHRLLERTAHHERYVGLYRPGESSAVHPHRALSAERLFCRGERKRHILTGRIAVRNDVLQQIPRRTS